MWNDPLALNRLAGFCVMGPALAFSCALHRWSSGWRRGHLFRDSYALKRLSRRLDGAALDHVTGEQQIRPSACLPRLTGTFFTADLEDARSVF